MRKLLLLAGAAAMTAAVPAIAKPSAHGAHTTKAHVAKTKVTKAKVTKAKSTKAKAVRISARDQALARRYGGQLCPPGLWKKTPSCMPPGQAKRLFREGQRLSTNYRYYTPYANIPLVLRNQYNLDPDLRYVYRDNVIYVVDPTTRLVTDIINAIIP